MACCEVCNGDEKRENSIMKTLLYRNDSVSSVYLLPTIRETCLLEIQIPELNSSTLIHLLIKFKSLHFVIAKCLLSVRFHKLILVKTKQYNTIVGLNILLVQKINVRTTKF